MKPKKAIVAIRKQVMKRRNFILSPELESDCQLLCASLWICARGVHSRRTQAPRRKSQGLACAGGGRPNGLDASHQRNCGDSAGTSAIRGNDHDRIAFLKISERCSRHAT